jgi:hypothetical protein
MAEPATVEGVMGEEVVVDVAPDASCCCWNGPQPLSMAATMRAARREKPRQILDDDRGKANLPSAASDASVAV